MLVSSLWRIIVRVVLYRGQPAWTAATEVFDLISPAPAEVEPYLPHLRYLLLDANTYPAHQLEELTLEEIRGRRPPVRGSAPAAGL